jgi:signal transduction histidine kinase
MRGAAEDAGIRVGHSTAPDTREAVRELCAGIAQPSIGFSAVFCSPRHDLDLVARELSDAFPGVQFVGSTTAGEVSPAGYSEGTLSGFSIAADWCFSVSRLIPDISEMQCADARALVSGMIEEVKRMGGQPTPFTTFAFLLIDGMAFVEEQVTSALSSALGTIPLFGGSAGDDRRHRQTMVLCDGAFHANAAVLTLVHTQRPFMVFSTQHYVGTEEKAIVTAADPQRRLVTELNGETAAVEYARLLNQNLDQLRANQSMLPPLVVRVGGAYYARSIERINADDSLTLACAIDEGVPLSVGRNTGMLSNLEALFDDVRRSIGPPALVIGVDCCMRRAEAVGLEEAVAKLFAANRVVGFSAYGEQINAMHVNHTFTGVAIGPGPDVVRVLPPPAKGDGQVDRLESENAKLRKTVRVLLQRLERSMNVPGDTFSLFQNTVLLEETVRKRTEDLAELNRQLNQELLARREMEAALLQAKSEADRANESKTLFLAAISHDVQQPLNSARLLLGALLEESLSPGGRHLVGRIEGALETAEEMLGDFLDIAKLESKAITPRPSSFSMGPLLNQLAAEHLPQARRRGLVLSVLPCSTVVHTDRQLFQRVLRNLLANALRYTSKGRVLLGCRRRADHLLVQVWDTGAGIPQDKQKDIFRPFYQIEGNGGAGADAGCGLGLNIVGRICQVLDVPLDLASREGRGSVFSLGVPLGEADAPLHPTDLEQPQLPSSLLSGRTVLAVDDDPGALEALSAALAAWRCRAQTAGTVEQALALLPTRPELFIVDYHLGRGFSGLELLQTIASRIGKPPRAVVVSADRSAQIRDAVRAAGFEFLPKPVSPARLRSLITFLLC